MALLHIISLVYYQKRKFLQNFYKKFQNMALLHIISLVIPDFCTLRFISYRFRDKNFFEKTSIFVNFTKFVRIIKFSKYGALTYYNPCDPKFQSVSLHLLPFPR